MQIHKKTYFRFQKAFLRIPFSLEEGLKNLINTLVGDTHEIYALEWVLNCGRNPVKDDCLAVLSSPIQILNSSDFHWIY